MESDFRPVNVVRSGVSTSACSELFVVVACRGNGYVIYILYRDDDDDDDDDDTT